MTDELELDDRELNMSEMEQDPVIQTGYAFRPTSKKWEKEGVLPSRTSPHAGRLADMCREYGIRNSEDALSMREFTLFNGRRVDLLTVDLKTHFIRGYEVKVSRSDFLGDNKWQEYLRYFNYFYFVTPPGIIKKGELPPEVYHLEWEISEPAWKSDRTYSWNYKDKSKAVPLRRPIGLPYDRLVVRKRGKELQPRFTRETYTEHFFHKLIMEYVRKMRWRTTQRRDICQTCREINL